VPSRLCCNRSILGVKLGRSIFSAQQVVVHRYGTPELPFHSIAAYNVGNYNDYIGLLTSLRQHRDIFQLYCAAIKAMSKSKVHVFL